jgi:hypothetical protein
MRSILGALAITGVFGAAAPAAAAEWIFMTTSDAGSEHYYDKTSVKRSGGKVQFWSREDARNAEVEDDYPIVSDALEEIDCAAGQLRLVEIIDRDDLYQEVERFDFRNEPVWNAITPNTVAGAKRDIVCK